MAIQQRVFWLSAAFILTMLVLMYGLLHWVSTPHDGMIYFRKTRFSWEFIPLLVAIASWYIAYIWFVIAGFRTHWQWGLGILLFPLLALGFFYCHPERGKKPGYLWLSGIILFMFVMVFGEGT